jgi:hypothetical protein
MTQDPKPAQGPEKVDPLSATAMFLQALDGSSQSSEASPGPLFDKLVDRGGLWSPDAPSERQPALELSAQPATAPGEFTQFFAPIGGRLGARDELVLERDSNDPAETFTPPAQSSLPAQTPGEFTRTFAQDAAPTSAPPPKPSAEPSPRFDGIASRNKGFSAPGASDAASGESSFTRLLKAHVREAPAMTAEPAPVAAPPRPAYDSSPLSQPTDQSVTGMIRQLLSESPPSPGAKQSDTEAEGWRAASVQTETPRIDAGGVTALIHRLSPEPAAPIADPVFGAPPPAEPEPAPKTGPGQFTRMISRAEVQAALSAQPAAQPAPPIRAPGFSPPPLAAAPAPQAAVPKIVPPPAPAAPAFVPPAQAPPAPAFAAAAPLPMPKPTPAPAPAATAPKSALEAMVPYLLLVNTFLLLVLLLVVIFLIKSR